MEIKFDELIRTIRVFVDFLAVFGITFEILPIKFSPLRWLGNRLNKSTNERIDKIQEQVDRMEYENDMRDLRNVKSRIHQYGQSIRKGEELTEEIIKSAFDDLDVYDFYKDKYKYMDINGKKVKINGEVETDRALLKEAANKPKKKIV